MAGTVAHFMVHRAIVLFDVLELSRQRHLDGVLSRNKTGYISTNFKGAFFALEIVGNEGFAVLDQVMIVQDNLVFRRLVTGYLCGVEHAVTLREHERRLFFFAGVIYRFLIDALPKDDGRSPLALLDLRSDFFPRLISSPYAGAVVFCGGGHGQHKDIDATILTPSDTSRVIDAAKRYPRRPVFAVQCPFNLGDNGVSDFLINIGFHDRCFQVRG